MKISISVRACYRRRLWSQLIVCVFLLAAIGCRQSVADKSGDKQYSAQPRVIAISFALKSLTQELLDGICEVSMPNYAGQYPLHWYPRTEFIREMQRADLVICNGGGAQEAPWLNTVTVSPSKLVETINNIQLSDFLVVDDAPTHSHGPEGEHSHSGLIASTWLNPRVARDQAEYVYRRLVQRFPEHAARIELNRHQLIDKFKDLEARFAEIIDLRGKVVLSSEPTFKYLFKSLGVEDKHYFWSQEKGELEASMWEEFDTTRPPAASVMFWPFPPPPAVQEGLRSRSISFVALDAMIEKPKNETDYFSTMQKNLALITASLSNDLK
ncbi:MAG TPA: metal ABC transporter substrate-binding protein [Pirellulaceae bacterium]|nr:metal ABC transporter substrate-binding protein [Pirellulaceae bacterium]HMO90621.1 metal ABC transporter substrate-binding protein [Pirellulaceae bacterium]HMP67800.1 metal ABC transporter substrate-binding protein [Pirellulaceae bacterium]